MVDNDRYGCKQHIAYVYVCMREPACYAMLCYVCTIFWSNKVVALPFASRGFLYLYVLNY